MKCCRTFFISLALLPLLSFSLLFHSFNRSSLPLFQSLFSLLFSFTTTMSQHIHITTRLRSVSACAAMRALLFFCCIAISNAVAASSSANHASSSSLQTSWLLQASVVDSSPLRVPLRSIPIALFVRIQSCRPTRPADPHLQLPSLRTPVADQQTTSGLSSPTNAYPQNECIVWESIGVVDTTKSRGEVTLHVSVDPTLLRLDSLHSRFRVWATTKAQQLKLRKQCPIMQPVDWVWVKMCAEQYEEGQLPADDVAETEWDVQPFSLLLVNHPLLPEYNSKLQTRSLLWPFDAAGGSCCEEEEASKLPIHALLTDRKFVPFPPFSFPFSFFLCRTCSSTVYYPAAFFNQRHSCFSY